MKMKWLLLLFIIVCSRPNAQPAKNISHWQQVWLRYFNQVRINTNKWSFLLNFHFKTRDDFVKGLSQYIVEGGLNYQLSNASRISVVQAYAANYPDNGKGIPQPEYRPWQQYQLTARYGKNNMVQSFRLEERFRRRRGLNDSTLAEGYNFNFRLRYNLLYEVPLGKENPNRFSFIINNEVYLNFGKQIVYNYFDQNNFGLTFKYQLNPDNNFQFGYMHLFQQLSTANHYKRADVVRITYIHNTTLHKEVHH
jgi:hypothetical protein